MLRDFYFDLDEERFYELLENEDWVGLRDMIIVLSVPEVAELLMALGKSQRVILFRMLPRAISTEVFSYLEPEHMNTLIKDLTDDETRHLLANLRPDDRTSLLEDLPGQAIQRLMNLLAPEDLKEARSLLGFPEESVGRLMTPDYVAVRPEWTVAQALNQIRCRGKNSETINNIYVTDASWRLLDDIELRRIILANPDDKIIHLMDENFVSISAFEDREEAVRTMQKYDLFALPITDSDGVLLGIVTADDVFDVAQEEATEDFHKTAAVAPLKSSYRETSVLSLFTKRIGWLVTLVFVNLISSGVIAAFEETLATTIALAFFIPLLIDSGGNAGSQSATMMVRALATGDVRSSEWMKVILKELGVGAAIGLVMGLASSVLGVMRGGMIIGVVVGLSMMAIILVSNIVGVVLPFVLTRFKVDPAVASSPLITTVADSSGLLLYFSIATWMLRVFA